MGTAENQLCLSVPLEMLWWVFIPFKRPELPLFSFTTLQQRVGGRIRSLAIS